MKKTIAAMAVLGAFGSLALAESSVTLYGDIDESIVVSKPDKGPATTSVTSGFTTGSSRFGFRGTEDLGGGNKVGFILEQGYNISNGNSSASTRAFHRESALIVEGGWGKVTVGRLGTLGYAQSTAMLRGAAFGTTYQAAGWGAYGNLNFDRMNNAIVYRTPDIGGFSLHLAYSNRIENDDSSTKFSENSHYYGAGLLYSGGDINGSLIFEGVDNKEDPLRGAQYHLTLGGTYKVGAFMPSAIYQYQWGYYRQHAAQVGIAADCAGGTAVLGFKYITRNGDDVDFVDNSSATLWNLSAAYTYPLSKRTKVYGFAGYTSSNKGWKGMGTDDTNYKGTWQYNGWAAVIGMVHSF